MTTGLQLAIAAGGLVGLGVVAARRGASCRPSRTCADALERLSPEHARRRTRRLGGRRRTRKERLGLWAMRVLPAGVWVRTPTRELALLRIPVARFYGEKLMFAAARPGHPAAARRASSRLIGLRPARSPIPAVASLGLAAVMFFLPELQRARRRQEGPAEFTRALGAYIDLVALERNNGSGPRQAMEAAAEVGDSWVFRRLSEELTRSRWSGLPPGTRCTTLADELGLPELDDFADIMRLSGEEGAQVYATLRARSAAMRTAMLNDEIAKANAVGERMSIP